MGKIKSVILWLLAVITLMSCAATKKVESCLSDDVIAHVKKCSKQVFDKVSAWNYSLSDN